MMRTKMTRYTRTLKKLSFVKTLVLDGNPFSELDNGSLHNVRAEFVSISKCPSLETIGPGAVAQMPGLQSLTQFHSVDFSQSKISVKKCIFNNAQSRFASAVFDDVLGPPLLAWHTRRCPFFSVVPEATHEASRGPLKGAVSAQKALQGSETETMELLGGTEEKSVSPKRGKGGGLHISQVDKKLITHQ